MKLDRVDAIAELARYRCCGDGPDMVCPACGNKERFGGPGQPFVYCAMWMGGCPAAHCTRCGTVWTKHVTNMTAAGVQLRDAENRDADRFRRLDGLIRDRDITLMKLTDANERVEALRQELELEEWQPSRDCNAGVCPRCHRRKYDGHAPHCSLAAALAPKKPEAVCKHDGAIIETYPPICDKCKAVLT